MRLWHGGVPGLRVGDLITPDPNRTEHLLDGCPTCQARKAGKPQADDDNDPSLVYVTTDREYARVYASGWPRGDLYRVEVSVPLGEPLNNDVEPSWGVPYAQVIGVYARAVTLTRSQFRAALRKAGTTEAQVRADYLPGTP